MIGNVKEPEPEAESVIPSHSLFSSRTVNIDLYNVSLYERIPTPWATCGFLEVMPTSWAAWSDHRPSAPESYYHSHLGPEHSSSNQAQEDSQAFCTDAAYARTDAFDGDHANAAANNYSYTSFNADDTATSVLARIDAKASFAAEEDATPVSAACQASDSACPPFVCEQPVSVKLHYDVEAIRHYDEQHIYLLSRKPTGRSHPYAAECYG